jgi:hypothetical protein
MTLIIQKPTGAKLLFHQPAFPASPAPTNGDTWEDPVTLTNWTFVSATGTWRLT